MKIHFYLMRTSSKANKSIEKENLPDNIMDEGYES